jgi:hypothetical protein
MENAKASSEEVAANKEKLDSYNELYVAYKETGKATEELQSAALDLVNVYEIEDGALKVLIGDYEGLTEAIKKARKEELEKNKSKQKGAMAGKTKEMSDAMSEGRGKTKADGSYKGNFKKMSNTGLAAMKDENYEYLSMENGKLKVNVDNISDPQQMYAYY